MSVWAIIPIKAAEQCKTRLRAALSDEARRSLADEMLAHVVAIARAAHGIDRVLLLAPKERQSDLPCIEDPGGGLNAALTYALTQAACDRVIFAHADLPQCSSADLEALAKLEPNEVGVAPDRAGHGTNALSLPLPAARDFQFRFGRESFVRHAAETGRLGLRFRIIRRPGLMADIDTPEDLAAAAMRRKPRLG
jgi:2-phospho-L-lactate guanylyltransferase